MKTLKLFTKKSTPPQVTIKGDTFCPKPLNLEQVIELILLLGPYVSLIQRHKNELRQAIEGSGGLLSTLFITLADEIRPKDFVRAFAILLDKEPEWFRGVQAAELVKAIPVLDEVNDFRGLLMAIQGLMSQHELQ